MLFSSNQSASQCSEQHKKRNKFIFCQILASNWRIAWIEGSLVTLKEDFFAFREKCQYLSKNENEERKSCKKRERERDIRDRYRDAER